VVETRLEWARERFQGPGDYADLGALLLNAEVLAGQLLQSPVISSVLHGDLQPKNILIGSGGSYIAIDPFLVQGDVHAEYALWAVMQDSPASIDARVAQLLKLEVLEEVRLHSWAAVFAVAEYRSHIPRHALRLREYLDSHRGLLGA
jgi:streptomycin 6-kinase